MKLWHVPIPFLPMVLAMALAFGPWGHLLFAHEQDPQVSLQAKVLEVHDGDTILVNLYCNIPVLCKRMPVRISNIDTPELHSTCAWEKSKAAEARDATARMIRDAKDVVHLVAPFRDKYFRINAMVIADGHNVGQELLDVGLARPYAGEKKEPWPKCSSPTSSGPTLGPWGTLLPPPPTAPPAPAKHPNLRIIPDGWNTFKGVYDP